MSNKFLYLLVLLGLPFLCGCDPNRYKKCEWYLDPDNHNRYDYEEGMVPMCVRNYETRKQKCFIVAKLDYAKSLQGKPFKYYDLELEPKTMPRKIKSLKLCEKAESKD